LEISKAVEDSRRQTEQVSRAMVDQTRAVKAMTAAAQNIAKQMALIMKSNGEHSELLQPCCKP
jgi:hypothetical protein